MDLKFNYFIISLFLFLGAIVYAKDNNHEKRHYILTRTENPPVIDGKLDDPAWELGRWEGDFTQHEPYNGQKPSQPTEFCILYDDDYLYIGIRAYDNSPDSIVKRLTRRDQQDGDVVGIAFDSYHDLRTGFALGVSASGIKFDWIISNDGSNEDYTWDPNWWVSTAIDEQGWVAEMRIPFSQLRFEKNGNGTWGLQVFREIYRKSEFSFWQHIPQDAPGLIHRFGKMSGLENIEPRTLVEITPYAVKSVESFKAEQGNPFRTGSDYGYKAGLDAKIGITNNLTMDLTVYPDFGQVEADPSEVNLSAYETYFQEKRPFFIEGRNISSFPLGIGNGGVGDDNLFYSRRIGRRPRGHIDINSDAYSDVPSFTNILGAAKLTGRTGDGLSLAIIQSVTAEEKAEIDLDGERSFELVEPMANYLISRVQQEFNEGNTLLGGMFTHTYRNLDDNLAEQMHKSAVSGGVDFTQYFKDRTWMFNVNTAISYVEGSEVALMRTQHSSARYFQRPDANHVSVDSTRTDLTGTGGRIQLVKSGENWSYLGALLWKSPGFEINDLGYMREADRLFQVFWVGYRQWQPKGIYRNYNINFNQYIQWNFDGNREFVGVNTNGFLRFANYWSANAGLEYNLDILSSNHLRGGPAMKLPNRIYTWFYAGSDYRRKFAFGLSGNWGKGLENNSGHNTISPRITYKPLDQLNFSFNPSYSTQFQELQYVVENEFDGNQRYVFASLDQKVFRFSFRINLTILPDLTFQYWGQPFFAAGNYYDFKYITDPIAKKYLDRFHVYDNQQITFEDDQYIIDENIYGIENYRFDNPDFRFKEFLSNLVIRWEYNPGSSLYFVWSQNRNAFDSNGKVDYIEDMNKLFTEKPHNIFMIKFSYRIGVT